MSQKTYAEVSAYYNNGTGAYTQNTMGWTATLKRANAFPLETYSIFPTLADAEAYAAGTGAYDGLPYEGQLIAVKDSNMQKVYVLDTSMPNGLRQLAAGDDASHLQDELNNEISERQVADEFLSNFISTDISNAITSEVDARETAVNALSNAISTEVDARISVDEYLSTNLSISLEEGSTTLSSVLKSYVLKQGTREVGTIDIPKDFLVKSATVEIVITADVPYEGAAVGDKYIDLEINAKTGNTEDSHIFIPIKDFFVPYSAGVTNTISVDIGADNTISAIVRDGSIGTTQLSSKAVTTEKIADGAVGTTQLSNDAVTNDKIADSAVSTEQLSANAVTTAKIADDAVTNDKIADNAVGTAQLSTSAVTTDKIVDDAITTDKIADSAVKEDQIADDAVTTDKIADSAVTTDQIADSAVTSGKINDSAVTTNKINNSAVTADKLATDAVTNAKIADNAVGTNELSASAVTSAKIADSAVTTSKINDGAVTTVKIGANQVTTEKLADNAVGTLQLSSEAVTTDKIANSAVTTAKINDSAVTTDKINNSAVTTDKINDSAITNAKIGLSAVTKDKLSSDVIDFINSVGSSSTTYTDQQIEALTSNWNAGSASKTIISAKQTDGKIAFQATDIAIDSSQITDLNTVLGDYVPLSVASSSASSSNKLQTASEVSSIAQSYIDTLSVAEQTIAANKTITKISETDGKISVTTSDISVNQSQVNGLTAELTAINNSLTNLENNKLNASDFATLSNAIGLSAASAENKIVTYSQISSIASEGMHFKGVISKTSEEETDAAAISRTQTDPTAGDIIMIAGSAIEYIYSGTEWIQLGDELAYVTKTTYNAKVAELEAADVVLSTAIDNKIYIDGIKTESLSAIHISQDDFYQKVRSNTILSNELYIVSGDYVNAYDQQVRNVAEPTLSSDAATKNYVDVAVTTAAADTTELSGKVNSLSSLALSGVTLNGTPFTVTSNVAALTIDGISGGDANV